MIWGRVLTVRSGLLMIFLSLWGAYGLGHATQQVAQVGVIKVGPGRAVTTIARAAAMVKDGEIVEIDAGDYYGDVAVWKGSDVTVRGVGGQVRIFANGMSAEGKAIWVLRSGGITVENVSFYGTRVPSKNGAGIRFEKGRLIVRNCVFDDNENGILTGNDPASELIIENSEFANNGAGDGKSHNLYVGKIKRLSLTGSYFHHAKVGHLVKSRAEENHLFYNRLTDEIAGRASYELEFPNGGLAFVVGNLIEQSSSTQNPVIISYGAEGFSHRRNDLYLANNTIVDKRPSNGELVRIYPGAGRIAAMNNLLVAEARLNLPAGSQQENNFNVDWDQFVLAVRNDYRLSPDSKLRGRSVQLAPVDGVNLMPDREYVHPRSSRKINSGKLNPGAFQTN